MTFDELVDELDVRSADELTELAELSHHLSIEKRREEILKNAEEGMADWKDGKLNAYETIPDLKKLLESQ